MQSRSGHSFLLNKSAFAKSCIFCVNLHLLIGCLCKICIFTCMVSDRSHPFSLLPTSLPSDFQTQNLITELRGRSFVCHSSPNKSEKSSYYLYMYMHVNNLQLGTLSETQIRTDCNHLQTMCPDNSFTKLSPTLLGVSFI